MQSQQEKKEKYYLLFSIDGFQLCDAMLLYIVDLARVQRQYWKSCFLLVVVGLFIEPRLKTFAHNQI